MRPEPLNPGKDEVRNKNSIQTQQNCGGYRGNRFLRGEAKDSTDPCVKKDQDKHYTNSSMAIDTDL